MKFIHASHVNYILYYSDIHIVINDVQTIHLFSINWFISPRIGVCISVPKPLGHIMHICLYFSDQAFGSPYCTFVCISVTKPLGHLIAHLCVVQ